MRLFLLKNRTDGALYPLNKKEANFLFNVLRLSPGDEITARDADNNYYSALLAEGFLSLTPCQRPEDSSLTDSLSAYRKALPVIHLYQCICKGKKNESIARMAYEAGVSSLHFVRSRFCQETALSEHDIERISLVIQDAVQQSGSQSPVKDIRSISFSQALEEAEGRIIILHQSSRETTRLLPEALSSAEPGEAISLFVGSEGGFSEEECIQAEDRGALFCLLPTNILRAETAGIYAIGAIQCLLA